MGGGKGRGNISSRADASNALKPKLGAFLTSLLGLAQRLREIYLTFLNINTSRLYKDVALCARANNSLFVAVSVGYNYGQSRFSRSLQSGRGHKLSSNFSRHN
jgi:hypothetical protein